MPERLLVLHDSADFGGHERILLTLLPAILDGAVYDEVAFYVPDENERLRRALHELGSPRLRVVTWPFLKRRGEPYLAGFRHRYARRVRQIVKEEDARAVLLVQGRIEHLAVPALALPKDVRVVSYVPMAHRLTDMGRSGLIGDWVRRRLYRRPDRFIVPDAAIARQVAAAGGAAPVSVVLNVVAPPVIARKRARAALSLAPDARIALVLGRLEAGQKGLDLLLGALSRAAPALGDTTFLFVGDGPEAEAIGRLGLASDVAIRHVGWTDTPELYLAAADVLLLPSRWEGVPLVMLEAMTIGLPVLASRIDVFQSHLPADNLVDFATVDIAAAIDRVTEPARVAAFESHARIILAGRSIEASRAAFAAALATQ